jgi:hypothetical protein
MPQFSIHHFPSYAMRKVSDAMQSHFDAFSNQSIHVRGARDFSGMAGIPCPPLLFRPELIHTSFFPNEPSGFGAVHEISAPVCAVMSFCFHRLLLKDLNAEKNCHQLQLVGMITRRQAMSVTTKQQHSTTTRK